MSDTSIITEIQQQLAFQEQLLDSLNTTVISQQTQITKLEHSLALVAKQLKNMRADTHYGTEDLAADSKPPHY